jgi:hypothetical protein
METRHYLFAGHDLDNRPIDREHYLRSFDSIKDAVEYWSQKARQYRWGKVVRFEDGKSHVSGNLLRFQGLDPEQTKLLYWRSHA